MNNPTHLTGGSWIGQMPKSALLIPPVYYSPISVKMEVKELAGIGLNPLFSCPATSLII